jgi:hypothetical protein
LRRLPEAFRLSHSKSPYRTVATGAESTRQLGADQPSFQGFPDGSAPSSTLTPACRSVPNALCPVVPGTQPPEPPEPRANREAHGSGAVTCPISDQRGTTSTEERALGSRGPSRDRGGRSAGIAARQQVNPAPSGYSFGGPTSSHRRAPRGPQPLPDGQHDPPRSKMIPVRSIPGPISRVRCGSRADRRCCQRPRSACRRSNQSLPRSRYDCPVAQHVVGDDRDAVAWLPTAASAPSRPAMCPRAASRAPHLTERSPQGARPRPSNQSGTELRE